MAIEPTSSPLKRTPLYTQHIAAGARMVPFAGYEMPVQYPLGVLKEHVWTREKAGLFDVSHMGQAMLVAQDGRFETAARALEAFVPADILGLAPGQQRYTQLLAADGGIIDDLMVTRPATGGQGCLGLVVNAACKDADYAHLRGHLPVGVRLEELPDRALLALQGPAAASILEKLASRVVDLAFMTGTRMLVGDIDCHVNRSGYTGEDGFEISIRDGLAPHAWEMLAADPLVEPIGLGARDSLRLEAGLCLYGHDIDTTTSPIEAGLAWSIQKRRREEGGFSGAARIQRELKDGPSRRRVGIQPEGRAPAREGAEVLAIDGLRIGTVTSGGFGPTVDGPVAMGYVAADQAKTGTKVRLVVRGKALPARIVRMPFVPHRYHRNPA